MTESSFKLSIRAIDRDGVKGDEYGVVGGRMTVWHCQRLQNNSLETVSYLGH